MIFLCNFSDPPVLDVSAGLCPKAECGKQRKQKTTEVELVKMIYFQPDPIIHSNLTRIKSILKLAKNFKGTFEIPCHSLTHPLLLFSHSLSFSLSHSLFLLPRARSDLSLTNRIE
jgi:hypothetical protein